MSQHGARGRALAGQAAPEILAHYFAGTTLGSIDPATTVRVLLLDGFGATAGNPLDSPTDAAATWSIEGIAKTFPANARLTVAPVSSGATNWNLRVVSSAGAQLHEMVVSGGFTIVPGAASTTLQLDRRGRRTTRIAGGSG